PSIRRLSAELLDDFASDREYPRVLSWQKALQFCFQFRGLESNQHRQVQSLLSYRLDDPGISDLLDTETSHKVRGEGFEPSSPGSKPGSLPLADPRECPVGIEPTYLVWKTRTFATRPRAQAEGEGVEPSRLIARPFSRRLPSPIGLPFRS